MLTTHATLGHLPGLLPRPRPGGGPTLPPPGGTDGGDDHGDDPGPSDGGNEHGQGDGRTTPRARRRYTVSAYRFRCVDESGFDDPWWIPGDPSDEVTWVLTTKVGSGDSVTRSEHFGDVDTGESRRFRSMVVAEDTAGPIGLSAQLVETDQGSNLLVRLQEKFHLLEKIPTVSGWVAALPGFVRDFVAEVVGDDLMGSNHLLLRPQQLEAHLPTVGSQWFIDQYFGGRGGDLPWAVAGGPDYHLTYRVQRAADAPLETSVLIEQAAMARA